MNNPKVKIEIDPNMEGCEVTIRCAEIDETVAKIQKLLKEAEEQHISFFKDDKEFFLPLSDILFFETEEGSIWAHTESESFEVRNKLYELEERLPSFFFRISKSAILNVKKHPNKIKGILLSFILNLLANNINGANVPSVPGSSYQE